MALILIHAGAGDRTAALDEREPEWHAALRTALDRARTVLDDRGGAIAAVTAAIEFMEDEVELFNAGRGSVLCSDGTVEMSAALMRGFDRAAGAVAGVKRTRYPIAAAGVVLEAEPVLVIGHRADELAEAAGLEQCDPDHFVTERQQRRLREHLGELDGATVGAVCIDAHGVLAAGTSTGGVRGQIPGRVGDTPIVGAGTWADLDVAVSCTGEGEAFIRSGVARQIAALVFGGMSLANATQRALEDVAEVGGRGGLIAIDAAGHVSAPFLTEVMPRAVWRSGEDPIVAIGPDDAI
jgi:beta-aspartyl-peptidase (threonine type)